MATALPITASVVAAVAVGLVVVAAPAAAVVAREFMAAATRRTARDAVRARAAVPRAISTTRLILVRRSARRLIRTTRPAARVTSCKATRRRLDRIEWGARSQESGAGSEERVSEILWLTAKS
jgi:hypothetical protein